MSIGDCPTYNWAKTGTDSFPTAQRARHRQHGHVQAQGLRLPRLPGAVRRARQGARGPVRERGRDCTGPSTRPWALSGTSCVNDNPEAIIRANEICNRYGIDTISVGGTIAFAMECYENGLIDKNDTGGLELTLGQRAGDRRPGRADGQA